MIANKNYNQESTYVVCEVEYLCNGLVTKDEVNANFI